jgi:uncharacterized membrane protein YozB (DUF420 family)
MAGNDQQPYRVILRRVGYLLVAIGVVSLPSLIYSVIQLIDYLSSADRNANIAITIDVMAPIFLLIGYLLIRGDIAWARRVTWFAALIISIFFCQPY